MADRLAPTEALIALLADVDDRKVLTNEHDCAVYLDVPGDNPADVSKAVWLMEQAAWVHEPPDSLVWELTDTGRAVLEAGASG